MKKLRVWDLPLRLFHWALVVLLAVSFVTQYLGGNAMDWHFRAGYAVLVLVVFRLVWGLVGPRYARFSSFLYGPSSILGYLRGTHPPEVLGHNPLASLAVFALLGLVFVQALSGMFANDDIASEGPFARYISKAWSDQLTWFHKDVCAWLLAAMVVLHLVAIAWYTWAKKKDLVGPMLTGDQSLEDGIEAEPIDDSWNMRLLALALVTLCAALMYYLLNLPRSYL